MALGGRRGVVILGALAGCAIAVSGASAVIAPRRTLAATHLERRQAGGPSAAIAAFGDATVNSAISFDGSGSQGSGLQYLWDFGDATQQASGAKVTHTFGAVNDVTVSLTVRDSAGNTATATAALRVIPALGVFSGLPVLGQITPASSFRADLALDASGLSGFSASVNGAYLSSKSFDYAGGGKTLIEVPAISVANEDDAGITPLINESVNGIPLINNVGVELSYSTASGSVETVDYTTSLIQPPGAAAVLPPAPSGAAAAPNVTATPAPAATASPTPTPGPSPAGGTAAPAPGNAGTPSGLVAGYQQAPTQTPVPFASQTPVPIATTRPPGAATVAPFVTATPQGQPPPVGPLAWSITYPTYLPVVGRPVNEDDVNDYYLTGDKAFHHADDPLVRRWAIKIARNGGVFPNDPKAASDNIYQFVYNLLGIGDPGKLDSDVDILQSIGSGDLVPGSRSVEFICIAHAYFLSSLTRELGLPTREETIGLARPLTQTSDGSWNVKYYQEGANQVWYGGAWHHYDTWIGTRNRDYYLNIYLAEAAWYAYSAQSTPFLDQYDQPTGFAGHDFGIALDDGTPGQPSQWRYVEQHVRDGVTLVQPVPANYMSAGAPPPSSGPIVRPQIVPAPQADNGR